MGIKNNYYNLSNLKVGIDVPINIPMKLVVKAPLKKQILPYFTSARAMKTLYNLKVVLIDFADVKGHAKYKKSDFENMLSGTNYVNSPDNEKTYGSMAYYYETMSKSNVSINATIMNDSPNGQLKWIHLPHNKNYYRTHYTIFTDAENATIAAGLDVSTGSTTKLVYIYAGNFYLGGLNPQADSWNNRYLMCEQWGGRGSYDNETDLSITFAHIGIHCHEFGHLLGFSDLYIGSHPILDWCLMADGCDLGYNKGARPAPINPHYRYLKNWINIITPPVPNSGLNFPYSEVNPSVYMVQSGNDRYYVENRQYENFSSLLPGHNDGPGGILVWHTYGTHNIDLIEADSTGYTNEGYGDMFPGLSDNRNLDDFTSPNCKKFYSAGNSNVILHDISDPSDTMTALFGYKWFGNIPINETWNEQIIIGGSINVPFGICLNIGAGSIIKFNDYFGITVDGKIKVMGTSTSPILFTSPTHQRQSWGNIYIYSSNNDLEYCTFEYGNWAVKFYGYPSHTSGNVVKHCTFRNNDQALRIENSDVQVENSTLENNRHAFVLINAGNSSGIYLYGNTVQNNDRDGIYASNSTVDLFHNTIYQNGLGNSATYNGIYASNQCDMAFGGREWEDEEDYELTAGFNAIRNNHGSGIYVTSSSEVLVGDYGAPGICMAGYNSIYGNGTYSGKQINNRINGYTVKARKNYWGGTPTSSLFYGSVDYLYWLNTDPLSRGGLMAIPPGAVETPVLSKTTGGGKDKSIKLNRIQVLKAFIAEHPVSLKASLALREIFHYIRGDYQDKLGMRQSIVDYLDSLYKGYASYDLGKTALQLLVIAHESLGDMEGAISLAREALGILEGESRKSMMATLVTFYIQQNQLQQAETLFAEMKRNYSDDPILVQMLSEDLEDAPGKEGMAFEKEIPAIQQTKAIPVRFALSQNFPNPFNPTTTIRYQLPEAAHVTVAIYDVRGRLVETLVDGEKTAGSYSVQWDAANQPSGVYFYRIQAGQFSATKKLLLLK